MSYIEIPPELITNDLIADYKAWRLHQTEFSHWQEHFQDLVDVLIKHEIVSPPVHILMEDNGKDAFVTTRGETFLKMPNKRHASKPWKHWKGEK